LEKLKNLQVTGGNVKWSDVVDRSVCVCPPPLGIVNWTEGARIERSTAWNPPVRVPIAPGREAGGQAGTSPTIGGIQGWAEAPFEEPGVGGSGKDPRTRSGVPHREIPTRELHRPGTPHNLQRNIGTAMHMKNSVALWQLATAPEPNPLGWQLPKEEQIPSPT